MMLSKTSSRLAARKLPSQQSRSILGISKALDKRLYRAAKGVMPSISKTEQIALGCGTIGTFYGLLLILSEYILPGSWVHRSECLDVI
jgi:hypothetical protein